MSDTQQENTFLKDTIFLVPHLGGASGEDLLAAEGGEVGLKVRHRTTTPFPDRPVQLVVVGSRGGVVGRVATTTTPVFATSVLATSVLTTPILAAPVLATPVLTTPVLATPVLATSVFATSVLTTPGIAVGRLSPVEVTV